MNKRISVVEVEHQYDRRTNLPTKTRERPSESFLKDLRSALNSYLDFNAEGYIETGRELCASLSDWAASRTHLKPSTRHLHLRALLKFFFDCGYVEHDLVRSTARPFVPKIKTRWSEKALTLNQVRELLNKYYDRNLNSFAALRGYMVIATALLTAGRRNQLLKCCEWYLTETTIVFGFDRQKASDQSLVWKEVPLDIVLPDGRTYGETALLYLNRRDHECPPNPYFFCTTQGRQLHYQAMVKLIKAVDIGVHYSLHTLRHTAGTIMAMNVGTAHAAALLDHTSLSTTQRYIRPQHSSTEQSIRNAWGAVDKQLQGMDANNERDFEPKFTHHLSEEARKALRHLRGAMPARQSSS